MLSGLAGRPDSKQVEKASLSYLLVAVPDILRVVLVRDSRDPGVAGRAPDVVVHGALVRPEVNAAAPVEHAADAFPTQLRCEERSPVRPDYKRSCSPNSFEDTHPVKKRNTGYKIA